MKHIPLIVLEKKPQLIDLQELSTSNGMETSDKGEDTAIQFLGR